MKYVKTLSIALTITLLIIGYSFAGGDETKTMSQQICPVMTFGDLGCSVTKNDIYTDYEGKRIYFCCEGCVPEFQKDPDKYIKKLENEGVVLKDVPRAELKNKANPATDSDCEKSNSCGGCGGCGCS